MKLNRPCAALLAASAALLMLPAAASAEEVVVATDRRVVTTPNRSLLHSGVVTLGASYIPAFIVAVESPRSFDRQLFIPVAGPWMDFATRKCSDCEHERLNKALLITDGIFQGSARSTSWVPSCSRRRASTPRTPATRLAKRQACRLPQPEWRAATG